LISLLKPSFSPGDLENVARIRAEESDPITLDVFDADFVGAEWMGGVMLPCGSLSPGNNQIRFENKSFGIRSLTVRVVGSSYLESGKPIPNSLHKVNEGVILTTTPVYEWPWNRAKEVIDTKLQQGLETLTDLFAPRPEK